MGMALIKLDDKVVGRKRARQIQFDKFLSHYESANSPDWQLQGEKRDEETFRTKWHSLHKQIKEAEEEEKHLKIEINEMQAALNE